MIGNRPRIWPDIALLMLLTAAVIVLRTQGWRANRLNNPDMLPYYTGARSLVQSGTVLDHGDISSYSSFSPPGTVYLMVPGLLLTRDARLQRVPGDALVFAGMILLLYLTARPLLGRGIGLTAAALTAVSSVGYQGVYPVGHPVFVLGALAGLIAWVNGGGRWALPLALLSLAAGLYADLGILPFVLVVAATWLVFRPKVWWPGVAAAGLAAGLLWLPYLRFEASRGLSDIASIITLKSLNPAGASGQPCLATLPGESETINGVFIPYVDAAAASARLVEPATSIVGIALHRACAVLANLDGNFDSGVFLPGPSRPLAVLLFLVTMIGQTALLIGWLRSGPMRSAGDRRPSKGWPGWAMILLAAAGAAAAYVLLDPGGIAPRLTADGSLSAPARLVLAQARAYLPLMWVGGVIGAWLGWKRPCSRSAGLLALGLWIPYLTLVILAEPGRVERFRFLWPLQVTALVYGLSVMIPDSRRAFLRGIAFALAFVMLLPASTYSGKLHSWRTEGYAGTDDGETAVVDFLAQGVSASGSTILTVGYDASGRPAGESIPDAYHRPGAWIDYLLESRHGIRNDRALEGPLSDEDEYRIRDTGIGGDGRSISTSAAPEWDGFHLAAVFGPLEVYERTGSVP